MLLAATSVPALGGWDALLRLSVAAALGAAIGVEREWRDQEAGVRTHLLVSLGSALFTIVSAYGFHEFLSSGVSVVRADPTRIAAQIVTGIGFLGAGAIIREGLSIRGLTTAGSLWVVAGIGMASGAGYYWPAAAGTALTLFALWPVRTFVRRWLDRLRPPRKRLVVELQPGEGIAPLLDVIGDVRSIDVEDEPDRRIVTVERTDNVDDALIVKLSDRREVVAVHWQK